MIVLTRLSGQPLLLNCDMVESAEDSGETVITLTNGNTVVVRETLEQIRERTIDFKRRIAAAAADGLC